LASTSLHGVIVRPSKLQGKNVVGTGARILGSVSDVEIDPKEWKVTHLQVELTDDAIEMLGYRKPFLGRVDILLSVSAVKAVADMVSLAKPIAELGDFIQPSKRMPMELTPIQHSWNELN
jgi:sporulation protein YlmC with PRC-barrel domain